MLLLSETGFSFTRSCINVTIHIHIHIHIRTHRQQSPNTTAPLIAGQGVEAEAGARTEEATTLQAGEESPTVPTDNDDLHETRPGYTPAIIGADDVVAE